ncbi:MAG: TRAP transporter large permease subunit, partial [Synergistaceae bacterium]|nr:TRAP transporter large permease subunit [Synergistaceae bacterium]
MAALLFSVFIILLALGVPVAFSILTSSAVVIISGLGTNRLMMIIQRMFESCNSFSLIAVPFFILAGDLLSKGKISKLLVDF